MQLNTGNTIHRLNLFQKQKEKLAKIDNKWNHTNECVDNLTELWLEINSQMDIVMAKYLSHTYTHKNTHQQT